MENKVWTIILILCFASLCACNSEGNSSEPPVINIDNIDQLFESYDGCFVLYEQESNQYQIYNSERIDNRISPCSTFKIVNTLIGLETGVIKDENHEYVWDGQDYPIEAWNRNHRLRSAVTNSVVWYFQLLAEEVGQERMQAYIDDLNYGNKDISGGVQAPFWLGSTLEISPKEQVELLNDLYNDELPFEKKNMDIVKDILILDENNEYILSGKTGSVNNKIGWFIGRLETNNNVYHFATNILADKQASGSKAKEITLEILKKLDLYQGD